jgi:hypothetical protein
VPFFQCLLRGENFPGALLGLAHNVGFFTTRWVEADSEDEAELACLDSLRRDPIFELPAGHPRPPEAKVYVEEITEVPELQQNGGSGATWFEE